MKERIGSVMLCAVLMMLSASTPPWGNEAKKPDAQVPSGAAAGYLVGPGDVLDISVWKEEALPVSASLPQLSFNSLRVNSPRLASKTFARDLQPAAG